MEIKPLCFLQPIQRTLENLHFQSSPEGDILDRKASPMMEGLPPETSSAAGCSSLKSCLRLHGRLIQTFIYSTIIFWSPFITGNILVNDKHRPCFDEEKISTAKAEHKTNEIQSILPATSNLHSFTLALHPILIPQNSSPGLPQTTWTLQFLSRTLLPLFSIPGKIQCIFHFLSPTPCPQDAFLTVVIILITASSGFLIHLVLVLFLNPTHSNYVYLWVPGIGTMFCSSCYSLQCLEWCLVHR